MVGVFGLAKSFAVDYLSFVILHFLGSLFSAGTFAVSNTPFPMRLRIQTKYSYF